MHRRQISYKEEVELEPLTYVHRYYGHIILLRASAYFLLR